MPFFRAPSRRSALFSAAALATTSFFAPQTLLVSADKKKKKSKGSAGGSSYPPPPPPGDDPLGGLGGMDGLFQAETKCPAFTCPKGKKAVQKDGGSENGRKGWPVVYGCDKSAFDMMSMMDPSALSGGLDGLGKKGQTSQKLWKCCVGRDVGQQVCGRSKADIEAEYSKCTEKKCKGDKNCKMNAQFGAMMSGGMTGDKCDEYNKFQAANCECVDADEKAAQFKGSLKSFYSVFAKDKLPSGEIDDDWLSETVYKSFKKGEEPKIWNALMTKYSGNLRHEDKPKPKYDIPDFNDPKYDDPLYDDINKPEVAGKKKSADSKSEPEAAKAKKSEKKSTTTTSTTPFEDDVETSSFGSGGEEEVEDVEL